MPSPVTVNLRVNVDASGNVVVFGAGPDTTDNIIEAIGANLPVNALYDSTFNGTLGAGLIEFWEESSDMGNIYAKLASTSDFNVAGAASYKRIAKVLASGLERSLVDSLDAKAAYPFTNYSDANYTTCTDFGRLALSVYSHYLFGHVAATAAITNDTEFMSNMLSLTPGTASVKAGGLPDDRYAAWTKKTSVDTTDVDTWSATQTATDANLAIALVKAILAKGANGIVSAVQDTPIRAVNGIQFSTDSLANIVKQVIGQDASRAMDQDNNELAPGQHQILRFYENDTIYISITLKQPGVSVDSGANAGAPVSTSVTEQKYDIKLTLGPRNVEYDPPILKVASSYNNVVSSIDTFIQVAQNTTFDVSTPVSLSTFGINMTAVSTSTDKKRVRDDVIDSIFTVRTDITSFRVTKSDIGLSTSTIANTDIVVVKPVSSITATPVPVDSVVNSSTSIYASLANIGNINRFSIASKVFSIVKNGANTFAFTDDNGTTTTRNTGDIITYESVRIEFGSAIISDASDLPPPSTSVPSAPTALTTTPGDSQANVSFTAGADNGASITNYKYSIDGGATYTAFSPAVTSSPVRISGLTNGTAYSIKLRAVNSVGDGAESASVSVTPAGIPFAPSALSGVPGNGQATISFTAANDNGSTITNYKYSIDNGATYTAFSPAVSSSPVVITGLTNGTAYLIKLRAVNSNGEGLVSSNISVTPATSPSAPTALSATPGNEQATISFTAGANNGRAITNYKYSIDGGATYTAFSPAVTSSPVVITGLTNGTEYSVVLKAVNSMGDGVASASISVTTAGLPFAPSGLSATPGDGQAIISFTAGSDNGSAIINYKYSIDNGATYNEFNSTVTSSPVVISGLTNGTTYLIKLRAVNSVGEGLVSSNVSVTPAGVPFAPTSLSAVPGSGKATISFTEGADNGSAITNYKYSIDGGATYTAFSPAVTSSPVVINGLTNGISYSIKLKAVNSIGDGIGSASVPVTPAGVPLAPTDLSATPDNGQVTVSFTAGSDNGSAIINYKYSIDNGATYTEFSTPVTSSPVIITGLTNGTTYLIKLRAINSVGEGIVSSNVSTTLPNVPSAPDALTATPGDGQATLTFISGDDNGSATINYKYSIDGGATYTAFSPPALESPITITGLTNGTSYSIKLREVNSIGDGLESATVYVTPAGVPFAPTGLSVEAGSGKATISFTAGGDNGSAITNYKYSINDGATYTAFSTPVTSSPVVVTGLTNGTAYTIRLRAVNSAGDGVASSSVSVTPAGTPFAPTALTGTRGDGQATISFTAGGDNGSAITNYKYSIDGGSTYIAFSPAVTSSPVTITGLTNGTSYSIKLRAINSAGDGVESSSVPVTPAGLPFAPSALSATPGDGQATISFTAGGDNGSAITNYKYSINGGSTYIAFSPAVTSSPVVITGLTNGTAYTVLLRAVNSMGDGVASGSVSVTPAGAPLAPSALSATPGDGQATISFTAGGNNGAAITNYKYSIDGGSTYTAFSPAVTSSPVTITGLTNGTAYTIRLRAVNSVGDGVASGSVSVTPAGVPFAPSALSATPGDGQATISFTAGSNNGSAITNYKYSIDSGATYTAFNPAVTSSPVTITGLTNGTAYTVLLRAVNSVGDGVASGSVSVTPTAPSARGIVEQATYLNTGTSANINSSQLVLDSNRNIYLIAVVSSNTLHIPVYNMDKTVSINTSIKTASSNPYGILIKYNSLGIAEWSIFISTVGTNQVLSHTTDSQNNIYVCGYYSTPVGQNVTLWNANINPNIAQSSSSITLPATTTVAMFLIKYNSSGIVQWATQFKGTSNTLAYGVKTDSQNNIYINGYYTSSSSVTVNDANGNTQSASSITLPTTTNTSVFLVKYNSSGIAQFGTNINGPSADMGFGLVVDSSSNIYITGYYTSSSSITVNDANGNTQIASSISLPITAANAVFLVKYNSSGIAQWATYVDGPNNDQMSASTCISIDSQNNICICGSYGGPTTLYNASGNTQIASSIILPTMTLTSSFLVKYNSSGIAQWATYLTGTSTSLSRTVEVDSQNNIYIGGSYNSTAAITIQNVNGNTQSSSSITLPVTTGSAGYLIKYNSSGVAQWATNIVSGFFSCIRINIPDTLYTTGTYTTTPTLTNASGNTQVNSSVTLPLTTGSSIFLIKYS
jgi:hypothetical protein